jgi:hypothetical protein
VGKSLTRDRRVGVCYASCLDSFESIRAILTCTSEEFKDFYDNERLNTDVLVHGALDNIVGPNRELKTSTRRGQAVSPPRPLFAMLLHAPHSLGQRYVVVRLHSAHQRSEDVVVNGAKVWLHDLFLPSAGIFLFHLLTQAPDV